MSRDKKKQKPPKKQKSRGQPKKKGPLGGGGPSLMMRQREVERLVAKSEKLWQEGDPGAALDIMDELVEQYPENPRFLAMSASLCIESGMMLEGIERAEAALAMDEENPALMAMLAAGYLMYAKEAHAIKMLRRAQAHDFTGEIRRQDPDTLPMLEKLFSEQAQELKVEKDILIEASFQMERGELLSVQGEIEEGLAAFQETLRLMPDWTPPRNNLSVFQFNAGFAQEAIQTSQEVLEKFDQDDYFALSNLTRYYALGRQPERARFYLTRLVDIVERKTEEVEDPAASDGVLESLYHKTAEGLAFLNAHRQLYDLLKKGEEIGLEYDKSFYQLLAHAAYNVGLPDEASNYWDKYDQNEIMPFDMAVQEAIERPRPADAPPLILPYFDSGELCPVDVLKKVVILDEEEQFDSEKMTAAFQEYNQHYHLLEAQFQGLKFIPAQMAMFLGDASLHVIINFKVPEVIQALKDFALGVDGPEEIRRRAVAALQYLDELKDDDEVEFWSEKHAEWQTLPVLEFPPFDTDDFGFLDFGDDEDEDEKD